MPHGSHAARFHFCLCGGLRSGGSPLPERGWFTTLPQASSGSHSMFLSATEVAGWTWDQGSLGLVQEAASSHEPEGPRWAAGLCQVEGMLSALLHTPPETWTLESAGRMAVTQNSGRQISISMVKGVGKLSVL